MFWKEITPSTKWPNDYFVLVGRYKETVNKIVDVELAEGDIEFDADGRPLIGVRPCEEYFSLYGQDATHYLVIGNSEDEQCLKQ